MIYLIFGLGFYIGAAIKSLDTYKDATAFEKLKGLVGGILLWPLVLILFLHYRHEK